MTLFNLIYARSAEALSGPDFPPLRANPRLFAAEFEPVGAFWSVRIPIRSWPLSLR